MRRRRRDDEVNDRKGRGDRLELERRKSEGRR